MNFDQGELSPVMIGTAPHVLNFELGEQPGLKVLLGTVPVDLNFRPER